MRRGPGPQEWAATSGRRNSKRALKRAAEKKAAQELAGLSLPAAKKLLRRKNKK